MSPQKRFSLRLVLLCLILISGWALCEAAPDTAAVIVRGAVSSWEGSPDSAKQGTIVKLKVTNLYQLNQRANGKIILFLDDMPLKGLYPVGRDTVGDTLSFNFRHTAEANDTWGIIRRLGEPVRDFSVSVGPENGYPVSSMARLNFVFYDPTFFWIIVLLLAAFLVCCVLLVRNSNILRQPGSAPPKLRSYSLGRSQMAWWFFVIFSSFVLVTFVTGQFPSLPNSVLLLLGVAGTTGVLAAEIDKIKLSQAQLKRAESDVRETTSATQPKPSEYFWIDIISDTDGISLGRFQMVVWTILLSIVFLISAWRTLVLMDLDPSLLALMGISSGTYLGFKIPGK